MREDVIDLKDTNDKTTAKFKAERVYLGTYKYEPTEDVVFTSKGLRLMAPHCQFTKEKVILNIQRTEIAKIVCNFASKSVLIIYVLNTCGKYVRETLGMSSENEGKQIISIRCFVSFSLSMNFFNDNVFIRCV